MLLTKEKIQSIQDSLADSSVYPRELVIELLPERKHFIYLLNEVKDLIEYTDSSSDYLARIVDYVIDIKAILTSMGAFKNDIS